MVEVKFVEGFINDDFLVFFFYGFIYLCRLISFFVLLKMVSGGEDEFRFFFLFEECCGFWFV